MPKRMKSPYGLTVSDVPDEETPDELTPTGVGDAISPNDISYEDYMRLMHGPKDLGTTAPIDVSPDSTNPTQAQTLQDWFGSGKPKLSSKQLKSGNVNLGTTNPINIDLTRGPEADTEFSKSPEKLPEDPPEGGGRPGSMMGQVLAWLQGATPSGQHPEGQDKSSADTRLMEAIQKTGQDPEAELMQADKPDAVLPHAQNRNQISLPQYGMSESDNLRALDDTKKSADKKQSGLALNMMLEALYGKGGDYAKSAGEYLGYDPAAEKQAALRDYLDKKYNREMGATKLGVDIAKENEAERKNTVGEEANRIKLAETEKKDARKEKIGEEHFQTSQDNANMRNDKIVNAMTARAGMPIEIANRKDNLKSIGLEKTDPGRNIDPKQVDDLTNSHAAISSIKQVIKRVEDLQKMSPVEQHMAMSNAAGQLEVELGAMQQNARAIEKLGNNLTQGRMAMLAKQVTDPTTLRGMVNSGQLNAQLAEWKDLAIRSFLDKAKSNGYKYTGLKSE